MRERSTRRYRLPRSSHFTSFGDSSMSSAEEAVLEFGQVARPDQRHRREGLRQHIGERDVDRLPPELFGQLDRAVAALEVAFRVPDADQLLVVALVASGAVGEEAARLARPREVGDLALGQPLLPVVVRGGDAAGPDRVEHLGQREVVAERGRLLLALALGVGDRRVHALARPVRAAERPADAAGFHLGIHRIDELADRNVGIVAVHEVDVDIVGLQPVERLRRAAWRSRRDSGAANARPCR